MLKACKPVIAVHGGAGTWDSTRSGAALKSVREAAEIGFKTMRTGGSAVDAVVEAVALMEDSGNFNAGAGSTLNIEKHVEMEASVMDGATLQAGAAGLLSDVRNPVRLARLVMEETDHVFVVGKGAEDLARMFGLERRQAITPAQLERYEAQLKILLAGGGYLPRLAELVKAHPEVFQLETVGAVALDGAGNVAAATSTGGFPLKLSGRIGDSPSIGCGTYADNRSGACSASGVGEVAIRLVLAKTVCDYIGTGKTPQKAAEDAIALIKERISNVYNVMGLIAVDVKGRIGAAHSTSNLCWAYMTPALDEPVALLKAKFVN
ncbi:MAG: isoaspartyl peptidase/L-asparaginase family protein [Candidatus Bathyarchaeota archaeon]|nr:isoaspartyl peptidase/L-asparaginase family protein [Candidatus Bathyarchaeota archaeon]